MSHFKSHFDNDHGVIVLKKRADPHPLSWLEITVISDGGNSTSLSLRATREDLVELKEALSGLIDSWNNPVLRVVQ